MGKYLAVKCSCNHRGCDAWHVSPCANVQGVNFEEWEARSVADHLNKIEERSDRVRREREKVYARYILLKFYEARREYALHLREDVGMTFKQIGSRLGISDSRAMCIVEKIRRDRRREEEDRIEREKTPEQKKQEQDDWLRDLAGPSFRITAGGK